LFTVFKWVAFGEISEEEFYILYGKWLQAAGIVNYADTISSPDLSEDVGLQLACEAGLFDPHQLEAVMLAITNYHNSLALRGVLGHDVHGVRIPPVAEQWLEMAECVWSILDEDDKGYLSAENVMFLYISLRGKVKEPPTKIREQVAFQLEAMHA
jgi:hypothetical protein